jgi:aspartokinase/homoserine dehydrogenase 1
LAHIQERYDLTTRVVAIADRSGYLIEPTGLTHKQIDEVVSTKQAGRALTSIDDARAGKPKEMLSEALSYRLARPVFVDVSNDDGAGALFEHAFALGTDIVTANKAPLSGTLHDYERVVAPANQDRLLRAESTVGAGLPVLDTIQLLRATGDQVLSIQGCLSGTLGFIAGALENGATLSDAVTQAMAQGYTEPDPALDLSGTDVGRKALILARISGIAREAKAPEIEGFVPSSWIGLEVSDLMSRIGTLDEIFAFRVAQASEAGECLRFVATIEPGSIDVGLKSVPKSSPLGSLSGTDNMVVFHTERYRDQPLVVSGPGAGADVTAMGVLGDIIRIAMERA